MPIGDGDMQSGSTNSTGTAVPGLVVVSEGSEVKWTARWTPSRANRTTRSRALAAMLLAATEDRRREPVSTFI